MTKKRYQQHKKTPKDTVSGNDLYEILAKMPIIVTAAKRNRTTTSFGKNAAIL